MHLSGTATAIYQELLDADIIRALDVSRSIVPWSKNEVDPHEAAALFHLARQHNHGGAHLFEIGTAWGYSASVLAQAAPLAQVITITPSAKHHMIAEGRLSYFPNVHCLRVKSWEFLKIYRGPALDFIFVDGYHGMVVWDLPWWEWLNPGGVMVFHDYSPQGAHRQCVPVYETLSAARDAFRGFDVTVITDEGQGFVGWVKREGERLPYLDAMRYSWHFDETAKGWEPGKPEEQQ